jgi:hypothetical protein
MQILFAFICLLTISLTIWPVTCSKSATMPLQHESLIKVYRGTRRLGTSRPILVITSDTMDAKAPLAEYYVFHEFPDLTFLYSRSEYSHADALYLYDFGQYAEVFSAKALLESQLRAAQDRIEHDVEMRDRQVATEVFFSAAAPMAYVEADNTPLVEFAFFRRFAKERETMFNFSMSHAISQLKEKLLEYPEAIIKIEPKT